MTATIRLASPADADAVRDIYAPFVRETAISFEEAPPSVEETRERIESRLERYPWLVCERDGRVVGYAAGGDLRAAAAYEWTVELSVYVADGHRRSGVGRGLYTSLLAALERQRYRSAYAAVTVPNPASDRLHESMGFEPVGEFPNVGFSRGAWRGVRWWYRPLGERPAESGASASESGPAPEPDRPLDLDEARALPDWEETVAAGESLIDP